MDSGRRTISDALNPYDVRPAPVLFVAEAAVSVAGHAAIAAANGQRACEVVGSADPL